MASDRVSFTPLEAPSTSRTPYQAPLAGRTLNDAPPVGSTPHQAPSDGRTPLQAPSMNTRPNNEPLTNRLHQLYSPKGNNSYELGQINRSYSGEHNDTFYSTVSSQSHFTPVHIEGATSPYSSQCVLNRSDGSTIVTTPPRENRELKKKTVSTKQVKYTKIFSIMAIFLFPPSGFAALYFALKAVKEFDLAIQIKEYNMVRKCIKYSERLIILSIVCGILMYTFIFAGIGRVAYGNREDGDGRATPV